MRIKNFLKIILLTSVISVGIVLILNINVTTRQGINYQCRQIKVPLYLKTLDFFDRHYNYKNLVKNIIKDARDEEEKAMKIFIWTYQNIRRAPKDFPIIDDHVWYTIVRGYGVNDQFNDIFTTLCNYADIEAFFTIVYSKDRKQSFPFSFVKINGRRTIFDPYHGIYFRNRKGNFAQIEDLRFNNWSLHSVTQSPQTEFDYQTLFSNLATFRKIGFNRANIQSPLNRLVFEIGLRLGLTRDKK